MRGLFITGVGTGVGKTLVMTILCRQLRALGREVLALKPVVSGFQDGDLEGDPALILRSLGSGPTPEAIAAVSPWRFAAPVSPHQAARLENRALAGAEIVRFCRERAGRPGSIRLIEGAGGVMSPIATDATCLDVIAGLGDPAILVTGTYLGALSHTLTALSALRERAVVLRAIVVSPSAEDMGLAETIEALRHFGAGDARILALPRLAGDPEARWSAAPPLVRLCEDDHE